jgi:hypothetical protein
MWRIETARHDDESGWNRSKTEGRSHKCDEMPADLSHGCPDNGGLPLNCVPGQRMVRFPSAIQKEASCSETDSGSRRRRSQS